MFRAIGHLETFTAKSNGGVTLSGVTGNPNGAPILFIDGFSQCHLAWRPQLTDPGLTELFGMVAYDPRGHGGSDKPAETLYRELSEFVSAQSSNSPIFHGPVL